MHWSEAGNAKSYLAGCHIVDNWDQAIVCWMLLQSGSRSDQTHESKYRFHITSTFSLSQYCKFEKQKSRNSINNRECEQEAERSKKASGDSEDSCHSLLTNRTETISLTDRNYVTNKYLKVLAVSLYLRYVLRVRKTFFLNVGTISKLRLGLR